MLFNNNLGVSCDIITRHIAKGEHLSGESQQGLHAYYISICRVCC